MELYPKLDDNPKFENEPFIGDFVAVEWNNGLWYTGKILDLVNQNVTILYDDPDDPGPYTSRYSELSWIFSPEKFPTKDGYTVEVYNAIVLD